MDFDVRDRYKLITNIEALLDMSTKLNNPPKFLSISTNLALRLKMLSQENLKLSLATTQELAFSENKIGWAGKMHG
jgi:hypothetical protein